MGKDEVFGKKERRGTNGGASGGDCRFQSLSGEVQGFDGGLEGRWEFAAEGGEEAAAEVSPREGFGDESGGVLENF